VFFVCMACAFGDWELWVMETFSYYCFLLIISSMYIPLIFTATKDLEDAAIQ